MVSYEKLIGMVNGTECRINAYVKDVDVYTDLCNILSSVFFKLFDLGLNEYSNSLVEEAIVTFMYKIAFYAGQQNIEILKLFIVLSAFFKNQFD